jgi:hypothetical protein
MKAECMLVENYRGCAYLGLFQLNSLFLALALPQDRSVGTLGKEIITVGNLSLSVSSSFNRIKIIRG